ncbi:tetratricopeptide repeat protein [Dokdonia sp. Hel_I_53]|uniref:tetratricopeptide repeat protein n=1 Tax=Dokdonia sp. Hel_I_53 TaxID=1566287 RepID=UPI0011997167|nr:tetratricopeptide repeat protein [Dokdonia sp. Hel_I_53]TVZ52805.1 tetratricopeptide repeat protein [Dokdonia sp. Hel_I_53]
MKKLFLMAIATLSISAIGQTRKGPTVPENPNQEKSRELVIEGTEALVNQEGGVLDFDAFAKAESKLRTAIALTPESVPATYNAGNNYYVNKKWKESIAVLVKATEAAQTKKEKHKAFHNLGNAFYQQENWDGAVEAYKNALRADPTDEETRYNLQMAKKEKDKNGGGGDGGNDDKSEEKKDKGDSQDKNEKDNKGDGDKKEGDDGDEEETDDEGKDKKKDGEQKEDDKGKPKEQDQKKDGGEGDKKQPPPQPQQGQLSPQRVQSLLKAMQEQEQKTQEKINAQKVKGARVKTEKDW